MKKQTRVLAALVCINLVSSFQLPLPSYRLRENRIRSSSPSKLQAKPRKHNQRPAGAGGVSVSGTKKKKKNSKNKNETSQKASPSTATKPKQKGSSSSPSKPPWQVLSTKDAKRNIEKEKIRRQQAREGNHHHSIQNDQGRGEEQLTLSTAFLSETEQRFLNWKRFNPVSTPNGMKFVGSYLDGRRLPPSLGVPEVAFLGRSNVGKSSLLNRLSASAGQRDQARVGKTPGATASVNMYSLVDAKDKEILGFVDLPGFGYARLSKQVKESVQAAAENYLGKRRELCLGILLVDIRREPSADDRAVLAALYDLGVPLVVVATKTDKVSKNQLGSCLETIRDGLGLPQGQPLAISSTTGEGTRDLWKIILEACEEGVQTKKVKYDEETRKQKELDDAQNEQVEDGAGDFFVDDEDIVYNQGYDWVHGSDMDDFAYEEGEGGGSGDEYFMQDDDILWEDEDEDLKPSRESFQQLQQRARNMEKRGDV